MAVMVRTAQLTLLLVAFSAALAPVATVILGCDEDSGESCCTAACALCLCCAHQPPFASVPEPLPVGFATAPLGAPRAIAALSDHPRDIFHVPIAARSR